MLAARTPRQMPPVQANRHNSTPEEPRMLSIPLALTTPPFHQSLQTLNTKPDSDASQPVVVQGHSPRPPIRRGGRVLHFNERPQHEREAPLEPETNALMSCLVVRRLRCKALNLDFRVWVP